MKKKYQQSLNFISNNTSTKRNLYLNETFLEKTLEIYNGLKLQKLVIKKNMLGLKIGEFIPTRKKPIFKKKKTKK